MRSGKRAILKKIIEVASMTAKRRPDNLDELLAQIEQLPPEERRELLERINEQGTFRNTPIRKESERPWNNLPDHEHLPTRDMKAGVESRTPLGRELREIRKRIVAAGTPLRSQAEIDEMLAEQRGRLDQLER